MAVCRRCFVSGQVQGVFYRASAQAKARELGVNGYARNLPDGRVKVLCCGEQVGVDAFSAWLWQGPPRARVSDVSCMDVHVPAPEDFLID